MKYLTENLKAIITNTYERFQELDVLIYIVYKIEC